ncbi:MAG: hypothetical protein ABIH03_06550, partial [Pseudomonadota bacterium]
QCSAIVRGMNKRKTQNIRVHAVQRHALKIASARLDCPIHEVVALLMSGDEEARRVCMEADKEARK